MSDHIERVTAPTDDDWAAIHGVCLVHAAERLRALFPDGDPSRRPDAPPDVVDGLTTLFAALDGDMPLALLSEEGISHE